MRKKSIVLLLSMSVLAFLLVEHHGKGVERTLQPFLNSNGGAAIAGEADTSKVVFVVHCYDEGNNALQGRKGILKVERGFRYFREINTVYFDPKVITIEEMEKALKSAGTYKATIRE